jgi:DnaJ-domain-containing protein 1
MANVSSGSEHVNGSTTNATRAWIAREDARKRWLMAAEEWERSEEEAFDPDGSKDRPRDIAQGEAVHAQVCMERAEKERRKWFGLFDLPEKQEAYTKAKAEFESKLRALQTVEKTNEEKRVARRAAERRAVEAWAAYLKAESAWQQLRTAPRGTPLWARETLGVAEDATPQEIKSAYRQAARLYHPDRAIISGLTQSNATSLFRDIQSAYQILSQKDS